MQKIKADNKYREKELINGLEISDGINPNKKLILGADSNHVEMDTGRTLQEELDTYRAIMGKEFVSADGSAIEVNNAIPSKVLSAEIKGQTVKNYIHGRKINCTTPAYKFIPISENKNDFTQLEPGKTYTLSYNVLKTLNKILRNTPVITYDDETKVYQGFDNFNNVTGVKSWTFTIPIGKKIKAFDWWVSGEDSTTLDIGDIEVDIFSLVEGSTQFFEKLPFGLSSTQAIISNNGGKYTIYHPTELNEDGSKKVISLGRTSTKKDTLEIKDDGSAIYTQNTKDADDGSSRIDLPAPIMTHIDKSLLPTIITQQTNTIEVGGAVKPSSFKVTVPTTDGVKKEYVLTPINGWTGTAKANLLQAGDAELVLDLTIPEQFNTAICSLPTELRPKAERTVLGYNGNTPVVIKVLPTGEVKCMTQQSGKIELNDTYEI